MPRIFNRLSILLSLFACSFLWMSATQAATKTICALGCDYTSISAAFVGDGAANEVYAVQNSYNPGSESWPITFPTVSSTVTCVGGPVIDQPVPTGGDFINLSTSSTISGCTFGNVYVLSSPVGGNPPSGIQLLNNMFSNSVTSTIQLANGATNFVISGNTNINLLALQATSTNGLIENNTFYGRGGFYGFIPSAYMLEADTSSTNDQFIHNTFVSYVSGLGGLGDLIQIDGSNQTFATNTIQYATTPPTGLNTAVEINASGTNTITGNYIETPSNGGLCNGLYIDPTQHFDVPWTGSFTVRNNTIHLAGSCSGPNDGIVFDDYRSHRASTDSITLDMEYNLLDNAYPAVSDRSGIELDTSSTNVYTITGDYNGAYRFATTTEDIVNNDFRHPSYPDGPHSILATPYLFEDYVLGSASLDVAPFSPYLDVDGVNNIGASTGVRRSIIHVNQTGPIDFSTIDATSTDGDFNPTNFLRSGDTLSFAAGTYNGFTVDSSYVTSSITVEGVGVGTVIQARPNQDALTFTNVTSSYIQNLTVENATGVSGSYSITRMNFGYGGNSYNEAVPPYSIPTNTTFIMEDGGCSITPYGADGQNISSEVGSAVNNWHIGLMNLGGGTYHETLLVPNNIATSAGEVGADCAGMGFAVDQFIANAFTVSGGVFTYNAAAVAGAGATLIGGSSTPAITGVMTANAGIRLTGTTSGTTISNVTSTNNGSGISFGATLNGGNTVSESVFNNNLDQDVFSASNATNTFDNVDFTRTSSTITGTAPIMVRYETRLLAERNGSLVAVSGASASSTDGYSFVTSLGTTSGSGFTSYADLPAYEITSGSNALTNGGYNPYSFNVAAVNYFASSTSQLLSHRNQTITLVMNSSVPPTAPSGATVISMGSTTSTIGWTDNSDNETSFLLNYIDLSASQM